MTNKPPYGPIHWTHDTAPTASAEPPGLLTNLTSMHADDPTKAYGIYAEDILANKDQLPTTGHMMWGRTTLQRQTPQLDMTTRLLGPQRIVRTHQSWAQRNPV